MRPTVHVPHRQNMPEAMFSRNYPTFQYDTLASTRFEEAEHLSSNLLDAYEGYPRIQAEIIAETIEDLVFIDEVHDAAARIQDYVFNSPIFTYNGIKTKDETQQLTRSYKIRGATNFILKHADIALQKGVITASAGNHAQAVALGAAKLGIPAVIVVPEGIPRTKLDNIKSHGAQVIVHGHSYDESVQEALQLSCQQNSLYVPAYDHPDIMAGQATVGLELLTQVPDATDLVIPTGGGGLLGGIAKYYRHLAPNLKLWGSGIGGSAAVEAAFAGRVVKSSDISKLADGIAVRNLGEYTWEEIHKNVEGVLVVDEDCLAKTVGRLSLNGYEIEAAGAVGLAAIEANRSKLGANPVTVATGGNIDSELLNSCRALALTPGYILTESVN